MTERRKVNLQRYAKGLSSALQRVALPAFFVVWMTHVVLTELGDPLGTRFDIGLWLVASALHIAALVGMLLVLARVFGSIAGDRRRALGVFAVWSLFSVSLLLIMTVTRELWAPRLCDAATKYYSVHRPMDGSIERHRVLWIAAWNRGLVTATEAGFLIYLAAAQAFVGYRFGTRPIRAALAGCALAAASPPSLTARAA